MDSHSPNVIVIGAGMGGLAAAIRLAAAGSAVTLVEAAATPGGKMRTLPSPAGPVDAGPTVLTLRQVFDDLFALAGERLEDHLTLLPQTVLARHWWEGGSRLDLTGDPAIDAAAIATFAGDREGAAFRRFDRLAQGLHQAFDAPVMQAPGPQLAAILRATLARPALWPALLPGLSLAGLLRRQFRDPRLVQLFARYATYVGGRPTHAPGVLALIWRAEAAGVWAVEGGMHRLALALADLAKRLGVTLRLSTPARRIVRQGGRVTGVQLQDGITLPCAACVFAGDPAALAAGHLGEGLGAAVPARSTTPRSLSAWVWSFAARVEGPLAADLIHHNVFFSSDPKAEFGPLAKGDMPLAPTLYICAEDRAAGAVPTGPERFEIIINAPPGRPDHPEDFARCHARTFQRLRQMGLTFTPEPGPAGLTTPAMLDRLFPGSDGSIYGRSPEGTFAAFARPQARTALPGLYLAGGGAHPGAGVPMAALSGKHAAAAVMADLKMGDLTSRSMLPQTAMPGGTLTGSQTTARAPSR
ncbi:phytoene desaturase [Tabrizicola piscis]|uniref:Phytoene desaturase n=1 Tax=Tabrizicola piscis TaxID=2494374 RepID=A0A3S8UAX8_9RHOB|nr:1-hydroxycarotenoid 3,4-desaturase CrtD [Tabrizicola piscis]AZL60709.1 phytoene desaturase [Tabrizicola piscis]